MSGKLNAAIAVKVEDRDLIKMLVVVIESNTKAMEKAAEASGKMSTEVRGLRATIQGAQKKIGQQIGPALDGVKLTQKILNEEVEAVRRARG